MSKMKVKISETKFLSFYKTLAVYNINIFYDNGTLALQFAYIPIMRSNAEMVLERKIDLI